MKRGFATNKFVRKFISTSYKTFLGANLQYWNDTLSRIYSDQNWVEHLNDFEFQGQLGFSKQINLL